MLACRAYFVGADGKPMSVRGRAIVYWYDAPGGRDAPRPPLGYCEYDSVTLQKLKSDDHVIGLGYTLVASWHTFEPKYNHIWAHVCFIPEKGDPIYATPHEISLNGDTSVVGEQSSVPVVLATPQQLSSNAGPFGVGNLPVKTTVTLAPVDAFGMGARPPVTSTWNSPR
jgi:hypothetical protein